jgi:hypothetical protein
VFVTWFQQFAGIPIYLAISYLGQAAPSLAFFPVWKLKWDIAVQVVPASAFFTLMITCGNVCLKNVQLSMYQVARSPSLLTNVIATYLVLGLSPSSFIFLLVSFRYRDLRSKRSRETLCNAGQKTNRKTLLTIGLVMVGVIVGSFDPSTLNLFGLLMGNCFPWEHQLDGFRAYFHWSRLQG